MIKETMMTQFPEVKALTFDVFGTILDLGGSLTPFIAHFLERKGSDIPAALFWDQWRGRQRLEQYQDTLMMLGHSGYLETVRRAFVYTLRRNQIDTTVAEVTDFMAAWQELQPFPDVLAALKRLKTRYKLVVLSNGDPSFLDHLVKNQIKWDFDAVISATGVGVFKPHPAVYRGAAMQLGLAVNECLMVSANAFDAVGARACGLRAIYVNRYTMPVEDHVYQPDLIVADFDGLADALGS
jgi:2-haloacid dehalogenase